MAKRETSIWADAESAYNNAYKSAMESVSEPMNPDVVAETKRNAAAAAVQATAPEGTYTYAYQGRRGIRMGIVLSRAAKERQLAPTTDDEPF